MLYSNFNSLKNNKEKLSLIDNTIKEQCQLGIIEKINNVYDYLNNHPECSFLPNMPIFNLQRESIDVELCFLLIYVKENKINV